MSKLDKITRFLWKVLKFSVLSVLLIVIGLLIAINTETFQTFAAQKAAAYLSKELGTRVEVERLKISFIKNVELEGVYLEDLHHDTLLYGASLEVGLSGFDYKKHKLNLDEVRLSDIKVKLLKYKGEPDFNFQFLADYFASSDTTRSDTSGGWTVKYGALKLHHVDFTYHLLRDTDKVVNNMNYRNIHVSNINGSISDIRFKKDTIFATITDLSAREQSGFVLNKLSTIAKVSPAEMRCDSLTIVTPNSYISADLKFKYDTWSDYEDFVNKVYIRGKLKTGTQLNFKDIAYFAEELNGFNETFYLTGKVRGFVNELSGSDLDFRYADNTRFKGDFGITGLPDINTSYIHFDAKQVSTTKADLEKFPIPPFNNPTHLQLPVEVAHLGLISYKGKFDGGINDFVTYGTFHTAVGVLSTDLAIHNDTIKNIVGYSGLIKSNDFNLSKLFPNVRQLGAVSLNAKIKGKGFTIKTMDTELEGDINTIHFNGYTYKNLRIDGAIKDKVFNGKLVSKDENADFDFDGTVNFTNKVPKMDFISTVNNLDLEKTNFSTSKLNGRMSSQILIDLNGDNIDNLSGLVNFDNTIYKTASKTYKLSSFNLEMDQETPNKSIELTSSMFNVNVKGQYNLSTLPDAFMQYLNAYFPTFVKTNSKTVYKDEAEINIKIKNFSVVKELLINDLMLSPNTQLTGKFDASGNYLNMVVSSDLVTYGSLKFHGNHMEVNSMPDGVTLTNTVNSLNLTDSLAFKSLQVNLVANDRQSQYDITWDNKLKPNYAGAISGNATFGTQSLKVNIDKSRIVLTDSVWTLHEPAFVTVDSGGTVAVNAFKLYNNDQAIVMNGSLSGKESDQFKIDIQSLQLSQFNPLLKDSKMSIDGMAEGETTIGSVQGKMVINSNLRFSSLKVNNRLIGQGEITSMYNADQDFVAINGYSAFANDLMTGAPLKNFNFNGFYYPKKTENSIDIDFNCNPFDLVFLQPILKDIVTFKNGYVNGSGKVSGTPDKPLINAQLSVAKCVMLVDYLNVQYSIGGKIDIMPDQLNFNNMEVRDTKGNVGIVSGNLFHDNFKNMRIDFDINTTRLMVLNTTAANNPSYYGTAYATGNAGIYGFIDDIKMEINMKTNAGTHFYIPLSGPAEVGDKDFIRFVSKDTTRKVANKTASNFSLDFNLEATPDAEIQLLFDEKSGDLIKARGNGNINMKINSKGKFDMFGDYVLTTGDYLFTLETFITKKFEIERGSSIKWSGNVYKANIDITANYKQRASIKPLFPLDSTGNYSKRYPVDCKLYMKDNLMSPDITFGIDLPTIDETTRSKIKSILSDEQELNRQVFSLLLLRSFVTPTSLQGSGGISAGGAAAATGSEMLSNKLSHWLNGVTKDIDVGVNYRPGSTLSSDELDLALSKQLLNNRLSIDGNFGVSNNNGAKTTTTGSSNSSNLIGDVTVEYKLSDDGRYRVKAFNRSNDNTQITTSGGPFTQGVGVFYREEFETLNELYKRYRDKLRKKK
ncbi:MAG: translocation/assembly module TamB [Bacteroidetes bacterium]|nr:translocation/assembly module TamB [Bacteroidota bacterium]